MALGLVFAHIIAIDAFHNHPKGFLQFKYNLNKKSLLIALCFLSLFIIWILFPIIVPNQITTFEPHNHKGTTWFPQTIYVWYAWSPVTPWEKYDIVRELWLPNGSVTMLVNYTAAQLGIEEIKVTPEPISGVLIRLIQLPAKALCVLWVTYTFTPRRLKREEA